MSIKIVAFLQNPWFKPGTEQKHIELYRDNQDFHRRVLLMCMTGQRLQTAFGDLYNKIHWDNTNWRPSNHAAGREEPDLDHMLKVLQNGKFNLILTFGNQARDSIELLFSKCIYAGFDVMHCHHPNARFKTVQDLCDFAAKVRAKLLEYELFGGKHVPLDSGMGLEERNES